MIDSEKLAVNLLAQNGFLMLNRALLNYINNGDATILLTQLISDYQFFKKEKKLDAEDYFYSTIDYIHSKINLTRTVQSSCIQHLIDLNFITVKVKGIPGKRHFKLNMQRVVDVINEDNSNNETVMDVYDYYTTINHSIHVDTFTQYLTTTDNMSKELAFTLYFWTRYYEKNNPDKWVWKSDTVGVLRTYLKMKLKTGLVDYTDIVNFLKTTKKKSKEKEFVVEFYEKQKGSIDNAPSKRLTDYTNLLQLIN